MKHLYSILLLSATFAFTSCGKKETKAVVNNTPAIAVTLSTNTTENNSPFLTASGKIEAKNSANLSTRMMGYVTKIHTKVGAKVRKGQLLLSINNADLVAKRAQINARITEANAAFSNAKKDFSRLTALFNDSSASQKELDDITAHYNMAKARLEGAKQMKNEINAQFSYANIRAPFNGVVTNKFINTGDMANPGMPLLEVESPGSFQVTTMIPENEISQIKSGIKVNVLVKSLNKTLTGVVTEVSASAKNTGGQYLVKIALDKTDEKILSGMFTAVQFPIEKTKNTPKSVLIDTNALVRQGQLTGVYTVSTSNTALLRWLRLGRVYGDKVEVLSGLNANEKYIVTAKSKLYNGAKIAIQ